MVALAKKGVQLELLRVHEDSFGYDLILKCGEIIKFVQMKSRDKKGRNPNFDVHRTLIESENGVVILVLVSIVNNEIKLDYRLYAGEDRDRILSNYPKYKKDCDKFCRITIGSLRQVKNIDELAAKLFFYNIKI